MELKRESETDKKVTTPDQIINKIEKSKMKPKVPEIPLSWDDQVSKPEVKVVSARVTPRSVSKEVSRLTNVSDGSPPVCSDRSQLDVLTSSGVINLSCNSDVTLICRGFCLFEMSVRFLLNIALSLAL